MAPKKIVEGGYADDAETTGDENQQVNEVEQMDALVAQFSAMGLDSFLGDVAASSSDDLRTLLPKMMDVQEKMLEKCRGVSKELKLRDKDVNEANAKARAKARAEQKKAEGAVARAKVMEIEVEILGQIITVSVQGSCTVGELRRQIVAMFNSRGFGTIKKKHTNKMVVKFGDVKLSDTPRATLLKMKVVSNCRLEAFITEPQADDDEDDASDDEEEQ